MSVLITICEFSWSRLDQGNQWLSSLDVYLFHYARGWIRPIINCSRVVYQKCKPPGWNFDDPPRESSVHSDKPRCTPLTQVATLWLNIALLWRHATPWWNLNPGWGNEEGCWWESPEKSTEKRDPSATVLDLLSVHVNLVKNVYPIEELKKFIFSANFQFHRLNRLRCSILRHISSNKHLSTKTSSIDQW